MQRLPWGVSHVQPYLPLLPLAIEKLDLSDHPLATSSSHLVAKGVLTGLDQSHVSYVHTPTRYAWDSDARVSAQLGVSPLTPQAPCPRRWNQPADRIQVAWSVPLRRRFGIGGPRAPWGLGRLSNLNPNLPGRC